MEWTYGNLVGGYDDLSQYNVGIIEALIRKFPTLPQDFPYVFAFDNDIDFYDKFKNRYLKFSFFKDKFQNTVEWKQSILSLFAEIIYNKYSANWQRLKELYSTKYDQLNPFNMRSSNTITDVQTSTKNSTKKIDVNEESTTTDQLGTSTTREDNLTENFNHTTESDILESKVAAFNTTAYSNDRKDERSNVYNDEKKNSGTQTTSLSGEDTHTSEINSTNSETNISNDTANGTRSYSATRYGNIGNIPHQELFIKELEVLKHTIYESIFEDIACVILRESYCD